MASAVTLYLEKLRERHTVVKRTWAGFVVAFTGWDKSAAMGAAQKLNQSLEALRGELTDATTPGWLTDMRDRARALGDVNNINRDDLRAGLLGELMQLSRAMAAHTFDESSAVEPLMNLDQVVAQFHDQHRVDLLYNRAIASIEQALASGEIDSNRVVADLTRILVTIKAAKTSTFVNQLWQVGNLKVFLGALAKVTARKIPVVSFVYEVIEQAQKDLETTAEKARAEVAARSEKEAAELRVRIEFVAPQLGEQAVAGFLGRDRAELDD